MMALVHPVYDCLFRLAQSDALKNEEEVNLEHCYWGLTEMDQLNKKIECTDFQQPKIF